MGREAVLLNFAAACVVQDGAVLLQRTVVREVAEETGLQIASTRCSASTRRTDMSTATATSPSR
jgi:8-oxo-dGTP pyrophosphatase MutT (NUDIX family)